MPASLLLIFLLPSAIDFNRDVRPILSDACFACHGPDAARRKADLRLDTQAGMQAARGEILKRIKSMGRDRMPPPRATRHLTPPEKATLETWISQGAKWGAHWAFVSPVRPAVPPGAGANPIDRFLGKQRMSPPAAPEVWLRRISLDLTGLPPSLAEQDAFLADARPDARRRVIDRLLASPRFGERMAIRWLDAARYADTNGYQSDGERTMWRWRDWVIDAYNANMPFDRFTIEQLAGDLLPGATLDQKIATGFNRNHRGNAEGGIIPAEYAAEYVADRVETTSTVWLGLTMGCARCHDHKFDPLPTRDFYRMFAFFNNVPERGKAVKFGNSPPLILSPTRRQARKLKEMEAEFRAAFDAGMKLKLGQALSEWKHRRGPTDKAPPPLPGQLVLAGAKPGSKHPDAGQFSYSDRFSVSAFVGPMQDGVVVQRADDDNEGTGWSVRIRNGRVQFNLVKRWLDDAIRVESVEELPRGKETHVAVSYDGSRWASGLKIFLDGKPARIRVLLDELNQPFDTKTPLRVGDGAIRDVRLFNHDIQRVDAAELACMDSIASLQQLPPHKLRPGQAARLERYFLNHHASPALRAAARRQHEAFQRWQHFRDSLPTTMIMQEMRTPRIAHVLKRGQYDSPGERVTPATPGVLPPMRDGMPTNRLGLARWIVSDTNPLTARVAVNRLWQMLFGEGIVKTAGDFGAQGAAPSHPALLDWLAVAFRESGWDVKGLLRLIVSSEAYARSSRIMPGVSSFPRVRLSAEMVRDQALAAAGLLTQQIGGPSVKPYQPKGLWSELADIEYRRDRGAALYRRGLYTYWKRTVAPPGLVAFDAPGRETCSVLSSRTNTPLQALNLLNGTAYVEAARVLAKAAMRVEGDRDRIAFMMRRLLGRRPRRAELAVLLAGLARHRTHYGRHPDAAKRLLAIGDARPGTGAELAALAAVAGVLLNLDEAVTRE